VVVQDVVTELQNRLARIVVAVTNVVDMLAQDSAPNEAAVRVACATGGSGDDGAHGLSRGCDALLLA
jgi:hypothetical protein